MNTKNPELYRTVQTVRSILYFVLFALIILWIRGAQAIEPWTVLIATFIAVLEAVNLVRQFQPSPAARRSRQLESLVLKLKRSPGSVKFVEPLVSYSGSEGHTLSSVLDQCAHFVLTGLPGSGKTTTLQHITLALAQQCLSDLSSDSRAPLPFMIRLAEWDSGESLAQFLKDQWPYDGDPAQIMACSIVWFLADGLDELSGDRPRKVQELRRWLNSDNSPFRTVFTCRSERYDDDLRLPLPEVTMLPELSEAQVKEFAHQYLGADADRFLAAYSYDPPSWAREAIQGLSLRTPLVLTTLLQAFQDPKALRILRNPGAQVDVYLREAWNRELRRNPRSRFSFEEMVSACTRFMESSLWSVGGFTNNSLGDRLTVDLLALGILEHSHRQRSKRSRKWHAASAAIWLPLFIAKYLFPWVVRILIAVPLYFVPVSLWRARKSGSPVAFGRVFVQSLAEQLSEFLLRGPWVDWYWEIRQLGLKDFAREFRRDWPELYFELDTTPAYWLARRRARQLLGMLVDARILRGDNRSYGPSMPLVRKYFLAQGDHLRGASQDPALLGGRGNSDWTRRGPFDDAKLVIIAGIAKAPEEFITRLSTHDPYAAALCIASGIEVGPPGTEAVLANLLERLTRLVSDGQYRWPLHETYRALQYFSNPATIGALIDTSEKYGFEEVADEIIEIIVSIGRDAVPSLIKHLPACKGSGVRVVVVCLSRIGDERAILPLKQWSEESSTKYYELWARAALSHLGDVNEQKMFADQFLPFPDLWGQPEPFGMRCEPWRAYWETSPDPSRTLDEFLAILKIEGAAHGCFSGVMEKRIGAVLRLGPQLVHAYRSEVSPVVKRVIARALTALGVTEACDAFMADIYDAELVWTLIPALGTLKCSRSDIVHALIGYLQDKDPGIRSIALEALGQIRAASAALAISRLLSDTATVSSYNRRICDMAAEALSEIDSPVARERASAYYLSQLRETIPDSGKWFEIELRLDRLDKTNSSEIDRIRCDLMEQQNIMSLPSQAIEFQPDPVSA